MHKCPIWCGIVLLIVGILYLGQDLNWWNFWSINWWTILFLLCGIKFLVKGEKKK